MSTKLSFFKFFLVFSILVSFTACNFDSSGSDRPEIADPSLFTSPRTVLENMDIDFPDYAHGENADHSGASTITQAIMELIKRNAETINGVDFNTLQILEFPWTMVYSVQVLNLSINITLTKIQINYQTNDLFAIIYAELLIEGDGKVNCIIKCEKNSTTNLLDVKAILEGYCYLPNILTMSTEKVEWNIIDYLDFNNSISNKVRKEYDFSRIGENSSILETWNIETIEESQIKRYVNTKIHAYMGTDHIPVFESKNSIILKSDLYVEKNESLNINGEKTVTYNKDGQFITNTNIESTDLSLIDSFSSNYPSNDLTSTDFDSSLKTLLDEWLATFSSE